MKEKAAYSYASASLRLRLAAAAFTALLCSFASAAPSDTAGVRRADFRTHAPSPEVRHIADWAVHSGDHKGLPFIVVDKLKAQAVAFDRNGRLLSATTILIGMGVGDKFPPGIADLDMHLTQPSQRITPAGRYFSEEGENLERETVLWVDYDNGIALHKLSAKRTKQRRHERMATPDPKDNRITYGCINVPPGFYDRVVAAHFRPRGGIVYVLPDSAPLKSVFQQSYEVGPRLSSAGHSGGGTPATQRF